VETERAADLEAFVAATARGYQAAMADPDAAAAALVEAAPDLDAELVEASAAWLATRYASDPARWGRQEPERWQRFADFLVDAEILADAPAVDEAWTNEYLTPP
jgi:ABC-type nitrate/sulfonate/bicarbonate transport system substrate-binding protein